MNDIFDFLIERFNTESNAERRDIIDFIQFWLTGEKITCDIYDIKELMYTCFNIGCDSGLLEIELYRFCDIFRN